MSDTAHGHEVPSTRRTRRGVPKGTSLDSRSQLAAQTTHVGVLLGLPFVLLATMLASRVRADVVAPVACPPGLVIRGGHDRECWPRTCNNDSECGDGATCRSVARCIVTRQVHEGDSPDTVSRDVDQGPCVGDACGGGGSCRTFMRCEPREETPSFVDGRWTGVPYEAPAASSGCAIGAVETRAAPLWILGAVWLVVLRTRRRAR